MSDENHLKDREGFQEKYLWEDPLLDNAQFRDKIGPVLVAEEIQEYSKKYRLLVADDFVESDLKGASYYMRPDPTEAWIFDQKGHQVLLDKENEQDKQYYLVPQNSLIYIRLQQKLRLPYYIIGRHNLIIPYVYQGLLLGTGPQVDPGYTGKLFIPLHNLTNRDVKIYLGDSFISIDFVRTSSLRLNKGIPKSEDEFRDLYAEKCPIDRSKIERLKLKDYLKGATPTSSLGKLVPELTDAKKEAQVVVEKMERLHRLDIIAVAILVTTMLLIWMTSYYFLNDKVETTIGALYGEGQRLRATEIRIRELDQAIKDIDHKLRINQSILELEPEDDKDASGDKNKNIKKGSKDIKKGIQLIQKEARDNSSAIK